MACGCALSPAPCVLSKPAMPRLPTMAAMQRRLGMSGSVGGGGFAVRARRSMVMTRVVHETAAKPTLGRWILGGLALPALAGCTSVSPMRVTSDRLDYGQVVAESWKRQTLMNVVRLRYADAPMRRCADVPRRRFHHQQLYGAREMRPRTPRCRAVPIRMCWSSAVPAMGPIRRPSRISPCWATASRSPCCSRFRRWPSSSCCRAAGPRASYSGPSSAPSTDCETRRPGWHRTPVSTS